MAASVISALVGRPLFANVSKTCVAKITGICAASHIQRMSSCTNAKFSNPTSTAKSPLAISIPNLGNSRPAISILDRL